MSLHLTIDVPEEGNTSLRLVVAPFVTFEQSLVLLQRAIDAINAEMGDAAGCPFHGGE